MGGKELTIDLKVKPKALDRLLKQMVVIKTNMRDMRNNGELTQDQIDKILDIPEKLKIGAI